MPGPDRRCQLILVSSVSSRRLSRVSAHAELLYYKLLLVSDDAGRYYGSPLRVAASVFCHRMERGEVTQELTASWIKELENVGLIARYAGPDGDQYVAIHDIHRPIRSDRRAVIHFPNPGKAQLDPDGIQSGSQLDGIWTDTPTPTPTPTPTSTGRAREARTSSPRRSQSDILKTIALTGGFPPWVVEVLDEYLEYREEVADGARSRLKTPTTVKGWTMLARSLETAGERVSRDALARLMASGWERLSAALEAVQERRGKGRQEERPQDEARSARLGRQIEETQAWLAREGVDDDPRD